MNNYKNYALLLIVFVFNSTLGKAQEFRFLGDKSTQTISFELINNLIIIPVTVNGTELSFILDSGVGAPVIFNLKASDSLEIRDVEKIQIRGLGTGEPIEALHSKSNKFRMGNIFAVNKSLYIIHKEQFDLSSKLGITVHGMLGYDLLKNFVVTINYTTKKISFTKPENYKYKNCSKCETFDLEFYRNKPYINGTIKNIGSNEEIPVKLLIDSGGSDAIWLFEDERFKAPKNSFDDFIGEGITGGIFGKRNMLQTFSLKSFVLKKPNVAYLDSISTYHAKRFKERNGSLGGAILKRFKVIFDYSNSKITLKKNSMFKEKFGYNMSGIELMHYGEELVKKRGKAAFIVANEDKTANSNTVYFDVSYSYEFKPVYKIAQVRKNSPAQDAGIRVGDILVKINGSSAYNYDIQELNSKFYTKENKMMKLLINRNGRELEFSFKLKDLLK